MNDEQTESFVSIGDASCQLFGEITYSTAVQVCQWISDANNLPPKERPSFLNMFINSPGGIASAAFSIIEMMKASRIPIRTIGLGEIASAGLLIFITGSRGNRILTPSCILMSHHFNAGSEGSFHALQNIQKEYKILDKIIINHYIECTGLTSRKIRSALIPNRDVYLSTDEALELHLADKVAGLKEFM